MDLNEEHQFILAARKNPEQFGPIFDVYYPKIINYLIRRTADIHLSQDLASEVFLKAFNKLWQFRFKGVSFGAWLYQIANNEIRMHFRNKKPVLSFEQLREAYGFDFEDEEHFLGEIKEAETILESHTAFLKIQQVILTLPIKYQEVLALRFFEEKSILDIVAILKKKEGTVKSLISRGLQQIRDQLQPKKD